MSELSVLVVHPNSQMQLYLSSVLNSDSVQTYLSGQRTSLLVEKMHCLNGPLSRHYSLVLYGVSSVASRGYPSSQPVPVASRDIGKLVVAADKVLVFGAVGLDGVVSGRKRPTVVSCDSAFSTVCDEVKKALAGVVRNKLKKHTY